MQIAISYMLGFVCINCRNPVYGFKVSAALGACAAIIYEALNVLICKRIEGGKLTIAKIHPLAKCPRQLAILLKTTLKDINPKKLFPSIGASNHSQKTRADRDYYATDPKAIDALLSLTNFEGRIWECACGGGHMSARMNFLGYDVFSSDIVNRGYLPAIEIDFLESGKMQGGALHIITNPPYSHAEEFVRHAIGLLPEGGKAAFFLRILFLEGKKRKALFEEFPPSVIGIFSGRIACARNGDFTQHSGNAQAYAWYIWEHGFKGSPLLKWL